MKRIKDYLNKHNKLKRIVKILGIVAIVLSFLFNAVIIASTIITANKNTKDPLVINNVNKPKMVVNTTQDHYFIGSNDFNYDDLIYYLQDKYGNSALPQDTTTYNLSSTNGDFVKDDIDLCVFEGEMLEYNTYYSVTNIEIKKSFYSSDIALYSIFLHYNYNNNDWRYIIEFYVHFNISYFALTLNGGPIVNTRTYLYYGGTSQNTNDYYFLLYGNNTKGVIYDIFVKYSDKGYWDGYWGGFDYGFDQGQIVGYDNGYDAGVSDAAAGSMTSNPFQLIANAFDSVASILNIQVLPNLTLGVLIFTPLIVTIVIVVVKFMRG